MAHARAVIFHQPKAGSTDEEWEDGAGFGPADPATGRAARCVVVDGATEAYDSIRWVAQLVDSFLGVESGGGAPGGDAPGGGAPAGRAPGLSDDALDKWFGLMQDRWTREAPSTFANIFEERKFREEGSFATLLGCELRDLAGARPSWTAVALGDVVLFHVRGTRVLTQFPALAAGEFGRNPDGAYTQPAARARMMASLARAGGPLAIGDRLFIATDALAAWLVKTNQVRPERLWPALTELEHPARFRRIVADQRRAGGMHNDDVTLVRIDITGGEPGALVVCR